MKLFYFIITILICFFSVKHAIAGQIAPRELMALGKTWSMRDH